jgi:hypothetical protein
MSLFGKILAFLNILGAAGLVVMASMDFAARQVWGYNRFRHELVLNGLPLSDTEQAANEAVVADLFGPDSLSKVFRQPVEGSPVKTQLEEVSRVKADLDAKLQAAAASKRGQTHLLARILLPLADNHVEREQLLSARYWLATDAQAAAFKERYAEAFRTAVKPPPADDPVKPTFEAAFQAAVRAKGGMPSVAFTNALVKALPGERDKAKDANLDAVYNATFDDQLKQLTGRYADLFAAATKGPTAKGVAAQGPPVEAQKAFIARLLFGLCLFRAEANAAQDPALKGLAPDTEAFGAKLAETKTYRDMVNRVFVVCGLRKGLDAISSRSVALRQLALDLLGTLAQERQDFVADHAVVVAQLRSQLWSGRLQRELEDKAESERKLTVQKELVKKRQRDVALLTDDLSALRDQTARQTKALKELSKDLLDRRLAARDLIRKAIENERLIRRLEEKIRELESEK